MINPLIFREYDIRGTVGKDLTLPVVELLGRGIGTMLRREGGERMALGRDNRLSSPDYHQALIKGLLSTGIEITDLGMIPTPLLYFGLFSIDTDGGVMITGSHNPPEFNGFKVALGKSTIWGEKIQELLHLIRREDFLAGAGSLTTRDIVTPYREMVLSKIRLARPLRVAVDGGSGTAGNLGLEIIRALGCEATGLYCQPDGHYPGHFPDPTIPGNLRELIDTVHRQSLDVGVAYDGDADRIGVVDDKGSILWGDQLMIIYAREILKKGPASVVFEVKCSQNLEQDIIRHGGHPIMWKAGHSLIKEKMKIEKAVLGGEMSGHIFFADEYFGYDDAIYASLRLLRIIAGEKRPLSAMLSDVPKTYSTPEIRVGCPDEKKFGVVAEITEHFRGLYDVIDVDGVRVKYPDGWGLVRASNTQPALVLRFEAASRERLDAIRSEILAALERYPFVKLPPASAGKE